MRCWRIDVIALVRVCARSKAVVAAVLPDCWNNFGFPGGMDMVASCGCGQIGFAPGLGGVMGAMRRSMFGRW